MQDDHGTLVRLGLKHGAAWVLWLSLEGRDLGIYEGNHVAATAMNVALLETSDQKVMASFSSGNVRRPYKVMFPAKFMDKKQTARESMRMALADPKNRITTESLKPLSELFRQWRSRGMLDLSE